MNQQPHSFSVFLQEELQRRKNKNAGYSLRAFAKTLGLSSSFVSKILNAKKNVSQETMMSIAARLEVDEDAVQDFLAQLPSFKLKDMEFETVAVDQFQYISDWHHFAILEAVTLTEFSPEIKNQAKWFAERLSISEDRAASAIQRLVRLGLLEVNSSGKILGIEKSRTTIGAGVPTSANREHERQLLQKAIVALEEIPISERSNTSMTMAIPASRVKEAKEKIKIFQREMSTFLQRKGKRDAVYQMSIAFFPLTKITKK